MEKGGYEKGVDDLVQATIDGDLQRMLSLHAAGIGLNELNSKGFAAIHGAAMYGRDDYAGTDRLSSSSMLDALIHHGANVNLPDQEGNTALHYAAATGKTHLAKRLLEANARVDQTNVDHETPGDIAHAAVKPLILEHVRRSRPLTTRIRDAFGATTDTKGRSR